MSSEKQDQENLTTMTTEELVAQSLAELQKTPTASKQPMKGSDQSQITPSYRKAYESI